MITKQGPNWDHTLPIYGDAAFVAKALGDIARAKGMTQVARDPVYHEKVCTRPFQVNVHLGLIRSSKLSRHSASNCTPPLLIAK